MLTMYPACFYKEENAYSVIFPDLNWLATQGETLEEAMEKAVECLAAYIYGCQRDGDAVPEASELSAVRPEEYARELEIEAEECFVNMVSVDVAAYAKEYFEKPVKKTLSIPAWLNARALERGINFSQTLQEALIQKCCAAKGRN